MQSLIAFWSHAICAAAFLGLLLWRLRAVRQPDQRLLLAGFAVTASWAWLSAILPGDPLASFAETARNLVWIGLLHSLAATSEERQHGVRLVYGAVAAVLGFQLVVTLLRYSIPTDAVRDTATLLRVTAAAGSLILVHNLYGQASAASRSNIRLAMIGLSLMWSYDLNLYTVAYLHSRLAPDLYEWRGLVVALTAPMFAMAIRREEGWRVRLSRAATFQSLSLLAICGYFAVMAILATALRGTSVEWSRGILVGLLATMTVAAMVLLPSAKARGWAKVKISKHLFEHRYDYRTEWLRFTTTVGTTGTDAAPLGERVIKAFADILEAPGGLLLAKDPSGAINTASSWNWSGKHPPAGELERVRDFWSALEATGRIIEFDSLRNGWASPEDRASLPPEWMLEERRAWIGIPLIHGERLFGLILLSSPEYRRVLDWEDFDLLRTAGRQAASSLAEAHGQEALSNAQRFEEFNRRFAFILHDIKNLVSQLSLLSRNAERHADNPEFRADMVATLRSSVDKMNDLLTRLSPKAQARSQRSDAQPLRNILLDAIAAKRREHEVKLLGDTSLHAIVDAPALEQAVGHIIQNAVEASSPDAPITVRVAPEGDEVRISITDHGTGMDGDFVRNRLFQPFASTKPDGFGIGSFEARSLIAAMGGRLVVDSTPGVGSEFSIYLPAAEEVAQPQRKRA
ncbi:PEP-CTERM system histidine kinase PrsK [Sphingomonas daechungensis]|uniref:histidine kinase n=1 Tax=Sphingomonas daechungensis TaxID=1176646 RepID=A0ABX6T210_9SPHN|nr:XrtA/PEP-CTERM system histidine kinase PrsK [Sphingomonas daechungensis]QNP43864.1 PEP-CTERM system histidine kinase PrsK [Sphingomonas daechungensis]